MVKKKTTATCLAHNNQIIIYESEDGKARIEVRFENENVWLTQKLMAELFDCTTDNISLHLKNIFKERELDEKSVAEEYSVTASDGKSYRTKHYSLEAIIAVGYRVNWLPDNPGEMKEVIHKKGDLITMKSGLVHAYEAIEKTIAVELLA